MFQQENKFTMQAINKFSTSNIFKEIFANYCNALKKKDQFIILLNTL